MANQMRFRRTAYAGKTTSSREPLWHIAAQDYQPNEGYKNYEALCGYTVSWPNVFNPVRVSRAKRVPAGEQCVKCIEKMEKEES